MIYLIKWLAVIASHWRSRGERDHRLMELAKRANNDGEDNINRVGMEETRRGQEEESDDPQVPTI